MLDINIVAEAYKNIPKEIDEKVLWGKLSCSCEGWVARINFKIGSCGLNWNPTSNRNRTELFALQLTSMKLEFVVDLAASFYIRYRTAHLS